MLLDARENTSQDQDTRDDDGPQLDMESVLVESGLRGSSDDGQHVDLQDISCYSVCVPWLSAFLSDVDKICPQTAGEQGHSFLPVVLVHCLCIVDSTKELGSIKLRKPKKPLDEDVNVSDQAHLAVDTGESGLWVRGLVHFDNHQSSDQTCCCCRLMYQQHNTHAREISP